MARFQGKTKYIHGVIKDKRKGGGKDQITYEVKYDNGSEESRVAANLIIPLETEADKTNAKTTVGNEKKKEGGRKRESARQSFKEMQEERRRQKESPRSRL
jgi:hypothetical protein